MVFSDFCHIYWMWAVGRGNRTTLNFTPIAIAGHQGDRIMTVDDIYAGMGFDDAGPARPAAGPATQAPVDQIYDQFFARTSLAATFSAMDAAAEKARETGRKIDTLDGKAEFGKLSAARPDFMTFGKPADTEGFLHQARKAALMAGEIADMAERTEQAEPAPSTMDDLFARIGAQRDRIVDAANERTEDGPSLRF